MERTMGIYGFKVPSILIEKQKKNINSFLSWHDLLYSNQLQKDGYNRYMAAVDNLVTIVKIM